MPWLRDQCCFSLSLSLRQQQQLQQQQQQQQQQQEEQQLEEEEEEEREGCHQGRGRRMRGCWNFLQRKERWAYR